MHEDNKHILNTLHRLEGKLDLVLERLDKIMASIDDVVSDVQAESTLEDSVLALLTSIQEQLAAALASTTVPADVQAKIDSVFSVLEANNAKLTAAVTANTPANSAPTK